MKCKTVEIDIYETVTDEEFENILSLIRILEGTCGARLVEAIK